MGKTVVIIIIVCLCVGTAYVLSLKYVKLNKFYIDFFNFNNSYENQLSYSKHTLPYIIKSFNVKDNDFIILLKSYLDNTQNIELSYLNDEDLALFNDYVSVLGKTDEYSQKEFILNYKNLIMRNLENSQINKKKYCNLYIKLGIFIGLTLIILIM